MFLDVFKFIILYFRFEVLINPCVVFTDKTLYRNVDIGMFCI